MIANNHGIIRLWTQLESPFWHHVGFTGASGDLMVRLPAVFAADHHRPWSFYQLRSENAPMVSLDKEFAMFREAEKERTEKMFRQARVLKMIAVSVGGGGARFGYCLGIFLLPPSTPEAVMATAGSVPGC
jgi:hypothetical protein